MGDSTQDVLIIGAGMAGLMAARHLQAAGRSVLILDKARGLGGRLATRRVGGGVFDHGAQYFTARHPQFQALVGELSAARVLKVWAEGFHTAEGQLHENGEARYIANEGMTQMAKYLAQGLPHQLGAKITQLEGLAAGWRVTAEDGRAWEAPALLMTPPVPQSLALLQSAGLAYPVELDAVAYDPCYALMLALDGPSAVPGPGGLWAESPLAWIGDNYQKGISPAYGLTLHARADFTQQHWDSPAEEVQALLTEAARPYLNGAGVLESSLQRWRYSSPTVFYPGPYCQIPGPALLCLAGDAFQASRVEGAALSGLAAAESLLARGN